MRRQRSSSVVTEDRNSLWTAKVFPAFFRLPWRRDVSEDKDVICFMDKLLVVRGTQHLQTLRFIYVLKYTFPACLL